MMEQALKMGEMPVGAESAGPVKRTVTAISIKTKLTLALAALATVPMAAVSVATFATAVPQMERLAAQNLTGQAKAFSQGVKAWEKQNQVSGRFLASQLADTSELDTITQKRIQRKFVEASNGAAITTFATNMKGIQYSRDNDGKLSDISERRYFQEARKDGVGPTDVAFSKSTGKYTTLSGYRFRHQGLEAASVIGVNWNPDFFSEAADGLSLGLTGKASVVSNEGLFVYSTDVKAGEKADAGLLDKLRQVGNEKVFEWRDANGRDWLVAATENNRMGVRFLVMQESGEALAPAITHRFYAIWGLAFAAVFGLATIIFVRRSFVNPIVETAAVIRQISIRNPSSLAAVRIPHTGRADEVGTMARAVDHIRKTQFIAYKARARAEIRKEVEGMKGGEK